MARGNPKPPKAPTLGVQAGRIPSRRTDTRTYRGSRPRVNSQKEPPKHVLHFLAVPALPKTALGAGLSRVPQVNHAQFVVRDVTIVTCATFRRELTTICLDAAGALLVLACGFAVSVFGKRATGVAGAAIAARAGVSGIGSWPSSAGLQPVRMASAILDLVCNSETHAALSYLFGILDPVSQCPKVSMD